MTSGHDRTPGGAVPPAVAVPRPRESPSRAFGGRRQAPPVPPDSPVVSPILETQSVTVPIASPMASQ